MTVTYAITDAGRPLHLHLFQPRGNGNGTAIVFFFGGGWRDGTTAAFADQARDVAAKGYTAILPDYRVSCRDGSTVADSVKDAQQAYGWVRTKVANFNVDPSHLVMAGGSAGGHLALTVSMLASKKDKPAALILFNPAVDIVALAERLRTTPEAAASISPSVLPIAELPPTIIFHGQADTTVPIATVRAFCARAKAAGRVCELNEYAGQKHGFFHSKARDPAIKASPYDDTLAKSLAFLVKLHLDGRP